jgi:hypothetical protein
VRIRVEGDDALYEQALRGQGGIVEDQRKRYEKSKRVYRRVEREAFAEGFYWTCGRCEGTGRWVNGGVCFNCGGSGFHPTQSPHKFAASPKVRLQREAAHNAKRAAEAQAHEAALKLIGGRVEARLREVEAKAEIAFADGGEGWDALDNDEQFVYQLSGKLDKYGSLTEGQIAAIERGLDKQAKREADAEALKSVAPLAEGKREIVGEVVSTKWVESDYSAYGTHKMLVKLDDGTKVWGSVPRSLDDLTISSHDDEGNIVEAQIETLVGQRVSFSAQVERSRDDEHFGFFKRPTKAVLAA